MKRNPIKKVIILVSILAIPGFLFFYLLPQFAKNRYKSLPVFGEKHLSGTFHSIKGKKIPDTIYHQIPDFKLSNQTGDSISWKSVSNKILVLNLFNTEVAAPASMQYFKQLSEGYEIKPLVKFFSIAVNPTNTAALKDFAVKFNAKAGKWDLLTGDTAKTYPLIRKDLLLDVVVDSDKDKPGYIFSNKILLIDTQHRIRGIYEADNADATARLEDEIKVLIAEYLRTLKDGR